MMARLEADGNSRGAALVNNALQLQIAAFPGHRNMGNALRPRLERFADCMQSVDEIHIYEFNPVHALPRIARITRIILFSAMPS